MVFAFLGKKTGSNMKTTSASYKSLKARKRLRDANRYRKRRATDYPKAPTPTPTRKFMVPKDGVFQQIIDWWRGEFVKHGVNHNVASGKSQIEERPKKPTPTK